MLDKAFENIEKNKTIDVQHLKAEIETPLGGQKKTLFAQNNVKNEIKNEIRIETKPKVLPHFAIQIGAFSDYGKAMDHAKRIQKQYNTKLSANNIQMEKLEKNGKSLYRAQIAGLSEADAGKLCLALKSVKQACITANVDPQTQFAKR